MTKKLPLGAVKQAAVAPNRADPSHLAIPPGDFKLTKTPYIFVNTKERSESRVVD